MLINYTNHPSSGWSEPQMQAALEQFGTIEDIPFPRIDPSLDEYDLKQLAQEELKKILVLSPSAVHIMGEMSFTFLMIHYLMKHEVSCIASTTERKVYEVSGKQVSVFKFVKFRKYHFLSLDEHVESQVLPKENKVIKLNKDQQNALQQMMQFMENEEEQIFILKGYAGTGKTTLLRFLLDACKQKNMTVGLMATTGRAASILKEKTQFSATTVHSLVYRFMEIGESGENAWESETGQLFLNFGIATKTEDDLLDLYIVDEASMISSIKTDVISSTKFGSGNLLEDLLKVVHKRKVIFVGDPCQLPPVSEESFSAALSKTYMQQALQIKTRDFELTAIQRQAENSDILELAEPLREVIIKNVTEMYPKLSYSRRLKDVHLVSDSITLFDKYITAVNAFGLDSAKVISYSNTETFKANLHIRSKLFPNKTGLQVGDLLMVSQNCLLTKLNNGEQVIVVEIGKSRVQGHFTFIEVKVKALHNQQIYSTLILEKLLNETSANISPEDYKEMLIDFTHRMNNNKVIRKTQAYYDRMKTDVFLNALRVKYGYAITMQKAQGGEWQYVFLNISKSLFSLSHIGKSSDIPRWYYTGITRAQKALYITDGFWIKKTM